MNASFLTSLLSLFAGPVGNLLTTAIATGAASFVTYASAKGMDTGTATNIAVGAVGVASALINWGAGQLGVKINVINQGDNGVKVVASNASAPAVSAPLK